MFQRVRSTHRFITLPHRAAHGAALSCALVLLLVGRPAAAQQGVSSSKPAPASATPAATTTAASSTEVVCDTAATPVAPRKVATARPHKPRKARVAPLAAAAPATPKKRPLVVAHARKRRSTTSHAAGHRVAAPVVAKRVLPPQCHSAVAAAPPEVGAVADLVSALPWTAPVESAFPVATAPTLAELGGVGLRTGGTLAAGLLGAGAFWLDSHGSHHSSAVVPPGEGPGTGPGPNGPPPITTVPEPATLALVASGLAAIGARTRRRRRA